MFLFSGVAQDRKLTCQPSGTHRHSTQQNRTIGSFTIALHFAAVLGPTRFSIGHSLSGSLLRFSFPHSNAVLWPHLTRHKGGLHFLGRSVQR